MSALSDAMSSLVEAVGSQLPKCSRHAGYRLSVKTPAIIVGWPVSVAYDAGPAGRALYEVPVTMAVELGHDDELGDFLSGDGLPARLSGATGGWWGSLAVTTGELRGVVPNGAGDALVADIIVRFYA